MSINGFIKTIQNIMRGDSGINGDAQRIEQMTSLLFLKVYDAKEEDWEFHDEKYESIIPEELRWRNWAVDRKDGNAKTGSELLDFVNFSLFPVIKNLPTDSTTPMKKLIVKAVFEDSNQYMKDGVLLRKVINEIDQIRFDDFTERHSFGEIYETILKDLQSAGNAGEFYTPRAVTDFMVQMLSPKLGESIADFACGTGGFLTSTLKELEKQVSTVEDRRLYNDSIYGIEKKPLPYLLAITNMLIHDVDSPQIIHGNSLERNVREFKDIEKFDVILMNPPYGGTEGDHIKSNFPADLRTSETADLFMSLIMYRLKRDGRAAVIIPDGFLFGVDNAKTNIKSKLFSEFNVHTIVRMPHSVFAPYTSIRTNIVFFDNSEPTKETWFYRLDMPKGYKNFSKTKPMQLSHFDELVNWWNNRHVIELDGFYKANSYSVKEISEKLFNIDLCGFPQEEQVVLDPLTTIENYRTERSNLSEKIDSVLNLISSKLGEGQ